MPEGPEIRRVADRLAKALSGRPLESVFFAFDRLKRFESRLAGREVAAVDAHGKALLTRFDNGLTLYSHNQLYGRWYVMRAGESPSTGRSLRVGLHNERHSALLFSATEIEVLDAEALSEHPFLSRLGPDILDATLTPEKLVRRLLSDGIRRRSLGVLYLDQGFLAGSGNYLRSEILHVAGLHPAARPSGLDKRALQSLARNTLAIARRSYRTGGITNAPSRVRALKANGVRRGRYRFAVFGREGQPCYGCGTPIERIAVAGRRLYLCPVCQPPL